MYVGIAQAPGAVDVIDAVALDRIKSVPVEGSVHNVYVTPDGKFAVSGSVQPESSASSTRRRTPGLAAQARRRDPSDDLRYESRRFDPQHLRAAVELSRRRGRRLASRKESKRWEMPAVPGEEKELEGLQGSPAHGLAVTPDQKTLLATSKWYGAMYPYRYRT